MHMNIKKKKQSRCRVTASPREHKQSKSLPQRRGGAYKANNKILTKYEAEHSTAVSENYKICS